MFNRFKKDLRGQAMVEMALILPLFVLLLLGVVEVGRMYNAYLVIDHATREGARAGSLGATTYQIETKIKTISALLPNSADVKVTVTPNDSNRSRGQNISITTLYPFKFFAPMIGTIFGNPFNISSIIVARVE